MTRPSRTRYPASPTAQKPQTHNERREVSTYGKETCGGDQGIWLERTLSVQPITSRMLVLFAAGRVGKFYQTIHMNFTHHIQILQGTQGGGANDAEKNSLVKLYF